MNNELLIALVMVGGALALRMFLDRRAEARDQQMRAFQGDRIASVTPAPVMYTDPYSAFTAAKGRGQAKYLEEGFQYLGALDMAHDLRRLPSPEAPRPVEPTITPPSPAVPN